MNPSSESCDIASARLAAIVESSDDAIVGKTLEGVVCSWNRSAERIFGYSAEEVIGQPITMIIPPERHGEEYEVLARIRQGEKVDRFETVRRAKDGHIVHVSVTASPIRDSSGRIVGVSKVSRDISERKRIEQERLELIERTQAENRSKDALLALLGHELRNPLAAIASAAQVLGISRSLQDVSRPQMIIERQVAHLTRLVDDLLDAACVRMGMIKLDPRPVDLGKAIEHALDALRTGVTPARHLVEVDAGDVQANVDPVRLEQIIQNLVTNALKYTPDGRRISISARAEGNQAVLRVQDEGVGIAPEAMEGIFGLFAQGDRMLDRTHGGLGIGLTLVRTLAELHGGTIEAASEGLGRGSVFTIRLPLAERVGREPASGTATSFVSRRILIVEDNDDAREMMRLLLERQGHEVYEASDGAEGVRLALDLRPQLAFIDIGLPILDGYEVARLLRDAKQPGRLIALTGYGQPEDRERSLAAGFDEHLVKPILPKRLLAVLADVGLNPA